MAEAGGADRVVELMRDGLAALPPGHEALDAVRACVSAAERSAPRTTSPGAGTARAASQSVAGAAMAAAWFASSVPGFPTVARSLLGEAALLACSAAGNTAPEHTRRARDAAPQGWSGPDGGPFVLPASGAPLAITLRPHLPGGDWSLSHGGIPAASFPTPALAAEASAALMETLRLGS